MTEKQLEEILQCLSGERRLFPYFKDRYALLLLADVVGEAGLRVGDIKATRYRGLLEKPAVRELLARASDGRLTHDLLASNWPASMQTYRLTLGAWGGSESKLDSYYQTSRAGKNLVLQMNFPFSHNREYERLLKPDGAHPFENIFHPIAGGSELTLAWARIDLQLETGEALIEEIQCDWIRDVLDYRDSVQRMKTGEERDRYLSGVIGGRGSYSKRFTTYLDRVLSPHIDIWDEAMLSAAISFIRDEIGIRTIYYHTVEGGISLKTFGWRQPPRSLYSSLPRRFCFRRVDRSPSFLSAKARPRRGRNRGDGESRLPQFHLLEL